MRKIEQFTLTAIVLLGTVVIGHAQDETSPESPLKPEKRQEWRKILSDCNFPEIAKAYADFMIQHGRDVYGKVHSPLFVTAMGRKTATVFRWGQVPYPHVIAKPYAPGLRRDHKMRPQDRTYSGGNPLEDLPLYGLLYRLSELTGDKRYAAEADKSIAWFLANAQSSATGLFAWGSHMYWDVHKDQPIYASTGSPNGGYGGHEYNYVWPYWEHNPEALQRFAHGLWKHQIADQKNGHFSRHALYHKHGPGNELFEFPRMGSCIMDIWARECGRSGDSEMKQALRTLLKLYRSMRDRKTGAMAWCTAEGADRREVANVGMNLFMATTLQDAAAFVDARDPALAEEMREFVRLMDNEYLSNDYDKILDVAGKGILTWYTLADRTCMAKGFTPPPEGVDASVGFPLTAADGRPAASLYYLTPWFPGRSYAETALLLWSRYERCEEKHKPAYRRAILETANIYMTIEPEVQFVLYPDNIADVVELLRNAYKITGNIAYLHRADHMMRLGVRLFFDDTSPLPKITNFDDWYESSLKNESSVAILRQMLELSLDLETLAEEQRSMPTVAADTTWSAPEALAAGNLTPAAFAAAFEPAAAAGRAGSWTGAGLERPTPDVVLRCGNKNTHALYLSQADGEFTAKDLHAAGWRINLSDAITRIPSAAEADKLNGRMKDFTGKGYTTDHIAYGGFKDVPRQVALVLRNAGDTATRVRVEATLHDTYHDNGREHCEQELGTGEQCLCLLSAPASKWIRRLTVTSAKESGDLHLEKFAFIMASRNELTPPPAPPFGDAKPKLVADGLVLQLSGDALKTLADGSAVGEWKSQVSPELAALADGDHRPVLAREDGRAVLRFDGKDDFLSTADNDALDLKAWTLIVVARAEQGPGVILGKVDERNHMMNYRLQVGRDGSIGAVVRGESARQQVNRLASTRTLNRFSVIAACFDPTATGTRKINIRVDGVAATAYGYENAEGELTTFTHDRPLEIGRQPGREPRHFKGDIAEILLYNRALSDEEQNSAARWLFERRPGAETGKI